MANPAPPAAQHPFIQAMLAFREEQIRHTWRDRHYWPQRERLLRAHRRWSHRRGYAIQSHLTSDRYAQRHGPERQDAILQARRPVRTWLNTLTPAALIPRLEADLAALDRDLEAQDLASAGAAEDWLEWETEVPEYEGEWNLGIFTVRLHADGRVLVRGGNYRMNRYCHPHVASDGRLCTGRFGELTQWLYNDGALDLVVTTINQILRTYNPESPYIKLEELVGAEDMETCVACGHELSRDEICLVGEEFYCSECTVWCDGCEQYLPSDDPGETFDGRWFCQACAAERLTVCDNCGRVVLIEDGTSAQDGWTYCLDCVSWCEACKEAVLASELVTITQDGAERRLCPHCRTET